MTLNKQKILSELGSVVSQLQSADCGCMGKLFGNSNQHSNSMATPFAQQGGYRHSCCHGCGCGHNGVPSGEPYSMHTQQTPYCMGRCNPPKLYADTYSFLNENLMQPVVKEVYDDLNTISPANTIMNNEMGTKQGSNPLNLQMMQNPQMTQNPQMMQNSQMAGAAQNQQFLGGMGPQIMNMINGESIVNSSQPHQGRQLTEPMLIDAPQSPHGKVGVTPLSTPIHSNFGYYNNNPPQLYGNQQNISTSNVASSLANTVQANPMHQTPMPQQKPEYGQHNLGIKKFNEMFPGVMQGVGGDLGFDPMAIAIQMNPANQQQAAMNTMQKMMNNNENLGKLMTNTVSPAARQPGQNGTMPQNSVIPQNPAIQEIPANKVQSNLLVDQTQMANQQNISAINQPISSYPQQPNAMPMQDRQVYQASANLQMSQQHTLPPQSSSLEMSDLNTGAPPSQPNLETVREDVIMSQAGSQPQSQFANSPPQHQQYASQLIKEPIFPVDTAKQQNYRNKKNNNIEPAYNTLGQPVEKLPANMYQHPIPVLPQTLSPQPTQNNQANYSNVKATVSKTSLMGNKPIGPTPSRSQLQQIYNQYKGSQSFTQQNVKAPVEGASHSDRRLNVSKETRQQNAIPVEKTGGDSYANNEQRMNIDHVNGQIGDFLQENKPDLAKPEMDMPRNNSKYRNGLQDLVYTSYPTSAAWTFHGNDQRSHLTGRRYNRHHY